MQKILSHFERPAYAALRIVLGFLYWSHGLRGLFGAFGGQPAPMLTMVWFASVIETIAGTFIVLGFWTSCAAFIASGEMAVAYFIVHFRRGALPIRNGGDLAVALCFAFLYIATYGSGGISVDGLRGKK